MVSAIFGSRKETSDHPPSRRLSGLTALVLGVFVLSLAACDAESMLDVNQSSELDTAMRILNVESGVLAHADMSHQLDLLTDFLPEGQEEARELEEALSEIYDHTGINVKEDVHGVYFGIDMGGRQEDGGVLVFVDFDQDEIIQKIEYETEVIPLETAWPVDAFVLEDRGSGAVAFIDGSIVILASNEYYLEDLLERAFSDEDYSFSGDALFEEVSSHHNWVLVRDLAQALDAQGDLRLEGPSAMILPVIRAVQDFAAGVDFSDDRVEVSLYLAPSGNIKADDLKSVIGGVRSLARMQFNRNDELVELLQRIQIGSNNDLVEVSIEMDMEDLERFQQMTEKSVGKRRR